MKKVITYGTFDLFHQGHYNIIKRAKEYGDYLIVGVTSESYDIERGKLSVHDSLLTRIENVKKTGLVDEVIVEEYLGQKTRDIIQYNIDTLVVGSDWIVRELKTKGLSIWYIYDMTDKKDRQACFKEWDDHFASLFAPEEGEYEMWNKFEEMLRWKCNFYNVLKVINGKDKTLKESKYNRKIDKYIYRTVPGGAEFIKRVRKNLGIKTMKEVLHDKDSTFMFHFGDNDIYEINGMTELGRADENEYNTEKENEKIRNSKYESESHSVKRFFEILIGYFVERGKVDLSDPGLLDYWKINEKDGWYKKNHPGKKYYLDGTTATWKDVYNDMLKCNAIMHEG